MLSPFLLSMLNDVLGFEAHLGQGSITIIIAAIASRAENGRGVALSFKAQDFVVWFSFEALHGTSVDLQHGTGRHELSEGDVGLHFGPCGDVLAALTSNDVTNEHFAESSECVWCPAAHFSDADEIGVDISFSHGDFGSHDDEV